MRFLRQGWGWRQGQGDDRARRGRPGHQVANQFHASAPKLAPRPGPSASTNASNAGSRKFPSFAPLPDPVRQAHAGWDLLIAPLKGRGNLYFPETSTLASAIIRVAVASAIREPSSRFSTTALA